MLKVNIYTQTKKTHLQRKVINIQDKLRRYETEILKCMEISKDVKLQGKMFLQPQNGLRLGWILGVYAKVSGPYPRRYISWGKVGAHERHLDFNLSIWFVPWLTGPLSTGIVTSLLTCPILEFLETRSWSQTLHYYPVRSLKHGRPQRSLTPTGFSYHHLEISKNVTHPIGHF